MSTRIHVWHVEDMKLPCVCFGVSVITINRGDEIWSPPPPDFQTKPGDKLLVVGDNRSMEKLQDYLSRD